MNIELKIIASGIDNWAPITSGDIMLDASTDKYKKRFTPTPIHNEKAIKGNRYFFLGIITLLYGAQILVSSMHQISSIFLVSSCVYLLYINKKFN